MISWEGMGNWRNGLWEVEAVSQKLPVFLLVALAFERRALTRVVRDDGKFPQHACAHASAQQVTTQRISNISSA